MSPPQEIIGHERQRRQLLLDMEKGNVAHAYLFAGKRHLGKFTVARWFAGELLTQGRGGEERAAAIRLIGRNMHPDCLVLDRLWIADACTDWRIIAGASNVPQEHRAKAKVKTDTIGIDDIRALQERLHETSLTLAAATAGTGGRTVCLIRSLERLHPTAANALLHILEEPPPSVVFLCTTQSIGALPATIVSRLRVIHFSPLPRAVLEPLLPGVPDDDRAMLLRVTQGMPGVLTLILADRSMLRGYRDAAIAAERFLETPSLLERFRHLREAFDADPKAVLFLEHVFLRLREDLLGADAGDRQRALTWLRSLFPLLHTLQSNAHRGLLAARTALSAS